MITFSHRRINRQTWRWLYRRVRITVREMSKVHEDTIIFGTGFHEVDAEGLPRHIPVQDVKIPYKAASA